MSYRVFFSSGRTLVITDDEYAQLQPIYYYSSTSGTTQQVPKVSGCFLKSNKFLNLNNVDYILPEEETESGVESSPTPTELRIQKGEEKPKPVETHDILMNIHKKNENGE